MKYIDYFNIQEYDILSIKCLYYCIVKEYGIAVMKFIDYCNIQEYDRSSIKCIYY